MKPLFRVDTSFGGIQGRGVPQALQVAYKAVCDDAQFYIRSDIESFFTRIPKSEVLERISPVVNDADFMQLLADSVDLELSNLAALGENVRLFPLHELGVAQGCCLSPLMGNVLLSEFDRKMNGRGILCLRYIDDFLILGPSETKVRRAFRGAQNLLAQHGLHAYNPDEGGGKAKAGMVSKGFEFLGCNVRPGLITPNRKSRNRLLASVTTALESSTSLMNDPSKLVKERRTLVETLSEVNNIVHGWGNQYSYCNDGQVLHQLDNKIDSSIRSYISTYATARMNLIKLGRQREMRRLLGVRLLIDSKRAPIVT